MASTGRINLPDRIILAVAGRFGEKSKEVERFLKFSVVGTFGAMVDFGTLNLLQLSLLPPIEPHQGLKVALASACAFTAAVCSNFIWNRYWTYPDSRSRSIRKQLTMFFIINTMGLAFRSLFIILTYHPLGRFGAKVEENLGLLTPPLTEATTNQIGSNLALLCAIVIVLFWNFFANRYWTYNDVSA